MTTGSRLLRGSAIALVLVTAIAVSQAFILREVFATPLRFTSSSTQSNVQVIVSNPNPITVYGNLTLVLGQAGGIQRIWPAGRIEIPPGNSNHRVLIPAAITGVRYARVTNLGV